MEYKFSTRLVPWPEERVITRCSATITYDETLEGPKITPRHVDPFEMTCQHGKKGLFNGNIVEVFYLVKTWQAKCTALDCNGDHKWGDFTVIAGDHWQIRDSWYDGVVTCQHD